MKQFARVFLQGLILFIPLIITCVVLLKLFDFFVGLFAFAGFSANPFFNAFLGLVVTIGFIALLGMLASSFVFRQMFAYFEDKIEHAPVIRHIYSPIKDFTNAFVGNKRRFNRPVLVRTNPEADIKEIGFITSDDLSEWHIRDRVAVYMPLSYSLSGKLVLVPREKLEMLKAEPAEVMKFVLSGGVTDVEAEKLKEGR